jgi:hypothetical protein
MFFEKKYRTAYTGRIMPGRGSRNAFVTGGRFFVKSGISRMTDKLIFQQRIQILAVAAA